MRGIEWTEARWRLLGRLRWLAPALCLGLYACSWLLTRLTVSWFHDDVAAGTTFPFTGEESERALIPGLASGWTLRCAVLMLAAALLAGPVGRLTGGPRTAVAVIYAVPALVLVVPLLFIATMLVDNGDASRYAWWYAPVLVLGGVAAGFFCVAGAAAKSPD